MTKLRKVFVEWRPDLDLKTLKVQLNILDGQKNN